MPISTYCLYVTKFSIQICCLSGAGPGGEPEERAGVAEGRGGANDRK